MAKKEEGEGDLKALMRENYLQFASYVIRYRAIPHVNDGLKPVQRRLLHTLFLLDDGKLHKVANVVGQTMAYHPHGDAAISEALINLATKGYLLDTQGNFGNLYTGDPPAASRYIETRLSSLAKETLFNPEITATIASYDGRHREPIILPAKIPLLLLHGAEGIAVGMSTRILPHNFVEVIEAEIAFLEGNSISLLPDFPTGGLMDASEYAEGEGKVRVRARMQVKDEKTIIIEEICFGTTTESLIRSIDSAAKRGKLKIDSINDYTASKVEIEIKLPRGQYAEEVIPKLYAFTDCEVTLHSSPLVIKENLPWEATIPKVVELHAEQLKGYIKAELEIERRELRLKIFRRHLERIFIEEKLYKELEKVAKAENLHTTLTQSLAPFVDTLERAPLPEDLDYLLALPIRRISKFDTEKNRKEIESLEKSLEEVEKKLRALKKTTIQFLKAILKKYGDRYPRKTEVAELTTVDRRELQRKEISVGFDAEKGFLGTGVSSKVEIQCSNLDKLLLFTRQGHYRVIPIPEKQYVNEDEEEVIYVGVADKETLFTAIYLDGESKQAYGKRFIIDKFIMERVYPYLPSGSELLLLTTDPSLRLQLAFQAKKGERIKQAEIELEEIPIKGVKTKGVRLHKRPVKELRQISS